MVAESDSVHHASVLDRSFYDDFHTLGATKLKYSKAPGTSHASNQKTKPVQVVNADKGFTDFLLNKCPLQNFEDASLQLGLVN